MGFSPDGVEKLDYNFEPYCEVKGIIPEPTTEQLNNFMVGFKDLIGEAQDIDEDSVEAALEMTTDRVYELVASLCRDHPTVDELRLVPPRIFGAFVRWLTEVLYSPKA